MSQMPSRTEKCYEPVFSRFKEVAEELLREIPELRTLVLVCDWEVGQHDFPFGAIVPRSESTPDIISECLKQTNKMLVHQISILRQMIEVAEAHRKRLSDEISELEKKQS